MVSTPGYRPCSVRSGWAYSLQSNGMWEYGPTPAPDAEQLKVFAERERWLTEWRDENARVNEEVRAESIAAAPKYEAWFRSLLSQEQARSLDADGHVDVIGSRGNVFRIHCHCGHSGNVAWVRDGVVQPSMCAHPSMWVSHPTKRRRRAYDSDETKPVEAIFPTWYALVAQLLALTSDEQGFVQIAVGSCKPRYEDPAPVPVPDSRVQALASAIMNHLTAGALR